MANINGPSGFHPLRQLDGGHPSPARKYWIQSGYSTSIYTGDAVLLSGGYLGLGLQDSALLVGIFAGCEFLDASGVPGARFSPYWPASTATTGSADVIAWVYDDPYTIFGVQTYSVTAYARASHFGGSYDLISNTAGSVVTGQSGMELNLGDTGTGQFLAGDLVEKVGNAAGANAVIECMIRKHLWKGN